MPSDPSPRWPAVAAAYAAAACLVHRSALLHPGSRVIAGDRVGGVFVWDFWRPAGAAGSATLMYPRGVPILPHAPLTTVLGRAAAAAAGPFAAVNLLNLAYYAASGLAMYALALEVSKDRRGAALGGFAFMFSHYALTQHAIGHLGESGCFFLPLAALGFLRLLSREDAPSALLFAAGCAGTALSTPYLAFAWFGVGLPALAAFQWPLAGALLKRRPLLAAAGPAAGALAGAIAYFPLLVSARTLIGGSEPYSLAPLSFLDFPSWHPSAAVQALRPLAGAAGLSAENLMGFFGLSEIALWAAGLRLLSRRAWLPWAGLLAVSALLSLGPSVGGVVMPYAAYKALPFVGLLREPARLVVLGAMAGGALTALAFSAVARRLPGEAARSLLAAALAGAFAWEMGLSAVDRSGVPVPSGGAYGMIASDGAPGAVLELPAAIFGEGDVTINAQEYMLAQPLHGRPLVLGRPPRHTRDSLSFCESTEFVYELTHPAVLPALYSAPELRPRLEALRRGGRGILRKNGIRYVLFHRRAGFFPRAERDAAERLVAEALGAPALVDGDGVAVYPAY